MAVTVKEKDVLSKTCPICNKLKNLNEFGRQSGVIYVKWSDGTGSILYTKINGQICNDCYINYFVRKGTPTNH
jgi:hypothetical protein